MEPHQEAPISAMQGEFDLFFLNALQSMTSLIDKNEKSISNIWKKIDSNNTASKKSWEESENEIVSLRKNLNSEFKGSSKRISRLEEAAKHISNEQRIEIEKIAIEKMKKALNVHDEAQSASLKSIISNQDEKYNSDFVVIKKKMFEFERQQQDFVRKRDLMEVEARLGQKFENLREETGQKIEKFREETEKRLSKLEKGIGMLLNLFNIPYE